MPYYPGGAYVDGNGLPVLLPARPARRRGRLGSEARLPQYYMGANGELLVPAGPAHQRSNSVSGGAPHVNFYQDIVVDERGGRPLSGHIEDYYRPSSHHRRRRSKSGSPPAEVDAATRDKLKRLQELEDREKEAEQEQRLKERLALKAAKEEAEERERKDHERTLKKKAVEEWQEEERKKKEREKEEKEKADKEYNERMRGMLRANGYTDGQIDTMVSRGKKKEGHHHHEGGEEGEGSSTQVLALSRPTHLRIKHKYLDPETLDLYGIPWEWAADDSSYLIVKKWVNERDMEKLFEHSRKLRETKQLTYSTTSFRKENEQLLLVKRKETRKKSPVRGWFLT